MFFAQTSLDARTVHGLIMSKNTPATRPSQTSQLFGELASLVHLRLCLLRIFTGELVSPYFQHCLTFFIDILK